MVGPGATNPYRALLLRNPEWRNLAWALVLAFAFATVAGAVNFYERLHAFLSAYSRFGLFQWLANFFVVWLIGLLLISYRRWRTAQATNARLEAIISSISPDVLLVVDRERRILYLNRSVGRMFGFAPAEILEKTTDLLYSDRRSDPSMKGEIHDVLEREGFHVGFATGRRRDGTVFPMEIITAIIRESGGAVLLLRDITERRLAEEKQQKLATAMLNAQKLEALGMLAGGIAHDFNNLLMGIVGNASLLKAERGTAAPGAARVETIERLGQQAADLCRQMLSYAGQERTERSLLHLPELAEDMVLLLKQLLPGSASLVLNGGRGLPPIHGDPTQVRQVIMNLVTNAAEALGGRSGTILVSFGTEECSRARLDETHMGRTLPEGRYVFMEVSDTGAGIPPDVLPRIFDPFFTTKFTGRGLGLANVLGVMKAHEGTIFVESVVGAGSRFRVLFPAAREVATGAGAPAGGDPATPAPRARAPGRRILVVDDESHVLDVVAHMIESLGCAVVKADRGQAAVEALKREPESISAAVLDMTMPGMNGDQTLRLLRTIRPELPVILMSGYLEQKSASSLLKDGHTLFIQKPYRVHDLERCLDRLLSGSPATCGDSAGVKPPAAAG